MNFTKKQYIILSCIGILAGFINGMLGTGGGIIIIFALNYMAKSQNNPDSLKLNMVTSIISIIPMSIVSVVIYIVNGNTNYKTLLIYLPGAFVGGLLGAFLFSKFKTKVIKNIFAVMVIYAGVKMILK